MSAVDVSRVEALHDHWLRLWFSDGAIVDVDVWPLIASGEVFEQIRADRRVFEQVRAGPEYLTVTWPGRPGELEVDLDPDVLYGKFEPDPPVAFERRVVRAGRGVPV